MTAVARPAEVPRDEPTPPGGLRAGADAVHGGGVSVKAFDHQGMLFDSLDLEKR